jgi:hypothetical protein
MQTIMRGIAPTGRILFLMHKDATVMIVAATSARTGIEYDKCAASEDE